MADGWFGSMVAWVTDKPDVVWSGIGATVVTVFAGMVGWLVRRRKPVPAALVQPVPHNTVTGSTGTLQGVNAGGNVTVTTTVGAPLFDPMEIIREYGAAKEAKAHAEAATMDARRAAAEMAARLEAMQKALDDTVATQNTLMQKELTNAVAALSALKRDLPVQAPGIDSALNALREGRMGEAETLFTSVLASHEAAGRDHFRQAAAAARHLGSLAFQHDIEKALTAYRKAVELDPEDIDGRNRLGRLLQRVGKLEEAETSYQSVLALGERRPDKAAVAVATGNLGTIYQMRGDFRRAEEIFRKALDLDAELGNLEGVARHSGNLGLIYRTRGELDEAEKFHEKSLDLFKKISDMEGMASQYANLGLVHQARGKLDLAEDFLEKAIEINNKIGRKEGLVGNYSNLALIHFMKLNFVQAEDFLKKSLSLNQELGNRSGVATVYSILGVILWKKGKLGEAEETLHNALARNEELGSKEGMAHAYNNLAGVFEERGDREHAVEFVCKALALFRQVGMGPEIAQIEEYLKRIGADIPPP